MTIIFILVGGKKSLKQSSFSNRKTNNRLNLGGYKDLLTSHVKVITGYYRQYFVIKIRLYHVFYEMYRFNSTFIS